MIFRGWLLIARLLRACGLFSFPYILSLIKLPLMLSDVSTFGLVFIPASSSMRSISCSSCISARRLSMLFTLISKGVEQERNLHVLDSSPGLPVLSTFARTLLSIGSTFVFSHRYH